MNPTKMLCLDFDHTTVSGHLHSLSGYKKFSGVDKAAGPGYVLEGADGSLKKYNGNQQVEAVPQAENAYTSLVQDFIDNKLDNHLKSIAGAQKTGPKNGEALVKIMMDAIDKGDKVSIVSYSLYPHGILQTLKYMFKDIPNKEKYLNEICTVVGYAKSNSAKEEHISVAIKYFESKGVKIERKNCVLVDDDEGHIKFSQKKGFPYCVLAPQNGDDVSYLTLVTNHLTAIDKARKDAMEQLAEMLGDGDYKSFIQEQYLDYDEEEDLDKIYNGFVEDLLDPEKKHKEVEEMLALKGEFTVWDMNAILFPLFTTHLDKYRDSKPATHEEPEDQSLVLMSGGPFNDKKRDGADNASENSNDVKRRKTDLH